MTDAPLLAVDALRVKYGNVEALHGISLSVGQGEIVTILGANGAGKSTTLRTVSGLQRPSGGQILYQGRDVHAVPAHTLVHQGIAHSPEGRRLAVGVGSGGALNIWIKQLDHGPSTRLTFGGQDRRPFWSPDGRMVAYVRDSNNTSAVYARPADGGGQDQLLVRLDRLIQEGEWSRDGRWILVRTDNGQAGAGDIVAVRTSGDSTPVPVASSPYTELHPALSPDGRWLAYTSNESGIDEVYVRPFPDVGSARWQVSRLAEQGFPSDPRLPDR